MMMIFKTLNMETNSVGWRRSQKSNTHHTHFPVGSASQSQMAHWFVDMPAWVGSQSWAGAAQVFISPGEEKRLVRANAKW